MLLGWRCGVEGKDRPREVQMILPIQLRPAGTIFQMISADLLDTQTIELRQVRGVAISRSGNAITQTCRRATMAPHLLNVMEGVLGHVCHAHVGMLPHRALIRQQFPREQLHHGGLAGAIGAHDSHAGVEGALDGHIGHHLASSAGVPEQQT